jgi:hypothetical protein
LGAYSFALLETKAQAFLRGCFPIFLKICFVQRATENTIHFEQQRRKRRRQVLKPAGAFV